METIKTEKQMGIILAIDRLKTELDYRSQIAAAKAKGLNMYSNYDEMDADIEVRRAIASYEEAPNA